jgi:hypothetical protein
MGIFLRFLDKSDGFLGKNVFFVSFLLPPCVLHEAIAVLSPSLSFYVRAVKGTLTKLYF